ncbi:hypothetical protein PS020_24270, partial [Shigella sonnei]|nr:hypothetical protein [Shigella sonnei]
QRSAIALFPPFIGSTLGVRLNYWDVKMSIQYDFMLNTHFHIPVIQYDFMLNYWDVKMSIQHKVILNYWDVKMSIQHKV